MSTGIYQFTPVELALRNPILKSVIIEEPEINLHVDAQIEVAKRLATESTKRLVITTHSEWIPMFVAKKMVGRTGGLRIYEVVDGVLEERKVDEEGFVETFKTIFPKANKGMEELLQEEGKLSEIK
ncbi:ATP-binding protein [Metallosphaera tengchongensis]|uniref:ATP-binding protein n=1 Tax=Metallosphaera tengchongensis TaxID=1532350 RepID=UPI001FE3BD3B|nr:ATP-binding protein [Metallosphaera tengchongensis]